MSVLPIDRPFESDPGRIFQFPSSSTYGKGPVAYVSDREMRVTGNRWLFFAAELANDRGVPLVVAGIADTSWSHGNFRHLSAEAESFADMAARLAERGVPLFPFFGDSAQRDCLDFVRGTDFTAFVFDFSPIRSGLELRKNVADTCGVPVFEVDSRCMVPARTVSDKQEVGARTLRPKFWRNFTIPETVPCERFPNVENAYSGANPESVESALAKAVCDRTVGPVPGFSAGEAAARKLLSEFVALRLPGYAERRNDPNSGSSSGLSAHFRNGNLSPEEVFLAVDSSDASEGDKEAFLEEFLVRRELSENFCLHKKDAYDRLDAAPAWALKSLADHAADLRVPKYSESQFENGETHDDLWNACQNELVTTGKIASYLRMYWAKKILEWSDSPAEAHRIALRLNDRYALDGRSPNGYVGVLWSVAGLHDRPWFDRDVYGVVRYMNRAGCERKFDVAAYVAKFGNYGLGNADAEGAKSDA